MHDRSDSLTDGKLQTNSNNLNQQVELSYFEKRMSKPIFKIDGNSLQICFSENSVLLALGYQIIEDSIFNNNISKLIRQIKNKKILFRIIEKIPEDYLGFHHQETLRMILISTLQKISSLSQQKSPLSKEQIQQLIITVINFHPISEVSLSCFIRSKALCYFKENMQKYEDDLLGNQEQILCNYNSDLRNVPLRIISEAFNINFILCFKQYNQEYNFSPRNTNKKFFKIQISKKQKRVTMQFQTQSQIPRNKIREIILRKYDEHKCIRANSSQIRHTPNILFLQSLNQIDKFGRHLLNQSNRMDSITYNQNSCSKCGNQKKSKFCDCRKKSLPKTSDIKVEKAKKTIKFNYIGITPLNKLDLIKKKCKKCKVTKNLIWMDYYCGQCITAYNIKRCKQCNNLFQNVCQKCNI